jgi:hypothetical protein
VIDDLNYAVRRIVRQVMAMPEHSVRPAKQGIAAGGQTDEIGTVDIINDQGLGTGARTYETTGTVPSDVTIERIDQDHQFVASVNFYRRPPTASYLRGFTVSADPDMYMLIADGGFDISIDGTLRKVFGIDLTGVASMTEVASRVQARLVAELAGTTCHWDATNARLVVTSPSTNPDVSNVGGAVAPTKDLSPDPGPTDVSAVLGLTVAGGALPVNNRAGIARYSNAAVDRAHGCRRSFACRRRSRC